MLFVFSGISIIPVEPGNLAQVNHLCILPSCTFFRQNCTSIAACNLMIIDILATCVALRIGGDKLQPLLREMKNNLRSKRYA